MLNAEQFGGQQLRMFMTAREITSNYAPLDAPLDDYSQGYTKTWGRKYDESKSVDSGETTSIADSVRQHGVRQPVQLGEDWVAHAGVVPAVLGGHHRVAVEYHEHPDTRLLPVTHHSDFPSAAEDADEYYGGYDRVGWSSDPAGRGRKLRHTSVWNSG